MNKDKIFPITWEKWDGDPEILIFHNVTFNDNWGPYKAGDKVVTFIVFMADGMWQTCDTNASTFSNEGTWKGVST